MSERFLGKVRAPEFPEGLEWLNVERPLWMAGLRGKVVVLDFWTSCCINCHHVLPELRKIEERFPNEVVVIGVHSGKFSAEKPTYNLRQAVMRHDIRHPVVNDGDFLVWRAYAVRAWPTVMVVSPDGYVLGKIEGEFEGEALGEMLAGIIQEYAVVRPLSTEPIPLAFEKHKQVETLLSFPGKLLVDDAGGRLFVSDTEHHRVLAFDLETGKVRAQYGTGEPGKTDGGRRRGKLRSPQGLSLRRDALYVADTENHCVRKIALDTGVVTTVAGTGEQARPLPEAGPGPERALNSPWDVEVVGETLYVAMAGSHQLWAVDLPTGQLFPYAGDGHEGLKDGPRGETHLAQPSGLATDGKLLWFLDSETSSLRSVPVSSGRAQQEGVEEVTTHLGQGLFDFGDKDGNRTRARLQHPLGIACVDGRVFIADTYNNRIKWYDPATRTVATIAGTGEPGLQDGPAEEACFWEPGGISGSEQRLYVADTGNHVIRVIDGLTGRVRTVELSE
jgi:DNA-binding beta-propeller fold protein YncE